MHIVSNNLYGLSMTPSISNHQRTDNCNKLHHKHPCLLLTLMCLAYQWVHMYQCIVCKTDDGVKAPILVVCNHETASKQDPQDVDKALEFK